MKDPQKRFLALGGIVLIIVMIIVLPLHILSQYLIVLTMIFAALLTILFGMFIFSFKNIRESEAFGYMVFGLILLFFAISAGIIYYQTDQESKEMDVNSVVTTAKIVDGSIFRSTKGTSAEITVEFTTTDGKKIQADEIMTEKEFEKYNVGEEVEVRYSKSPPTVIRVFPK